MKGSYIGYMNRINSCINAVNWHIEMGRNYLAKNVFDRAYDWFSKLEKDFGNTDSKEAQGEIELIRTKLGGLKKKIIPAINFK